MSICVQVPPVDLLCEPDLLPSVVRWARLPRDPAVEEERRLAETLATQEAPAELPQLAVNLGTEPLVVDRLRLEYQDHLHVLPTNVKTRTTSRRTARSAIHRTAPRTAYAQTRDRCKTHRRAPH